jgi:hypothetical protein
VPASRHTYARLGINDRYLGLFALIEQVDKAFLRECFAGKPRGNLFKVYCGELGPGTLQRRVGADGTTVAASTARRMLTMRRIGSSPIRMLRTRPATTTSRNYAGRSTAPDYRWR